jgi:hypothetical protein
LQFHHLLDGYFSPCIDFLREIPDLIPSRSVSQSRTAMKSRQSNGSNGTASELTPLAADNQPRVAEDDVGHLIGVCGTILDDQPAPRLA